MTWRVLVCQAKTGVIVGELQPTGTPSWSTEIGEKGDWGCSLQLNARSGSGVLMNPKDDVLAYLTSGAYFWAVANGTFIGQAGPPTGGKFEDGLFQISGSGIGHLLEHRVARQPNGTPATIGASSNDWGFTTMTKRSYMRELVGKSVADSDSGAVLPIDYSDGNGEVGSVARSVKGHELVSVWKKLTDETDNQDSPEFILRPYFTLVGSAPAIAFKLALGTPKLGDANLPAVWELGAAFGNVSVDYNVAVPRPHRSWSKGAGEGPAAVFGYAQNTAPLQAAGVPYADYVDTSHADVSVKATADGYATANLNDFSVPTETWTASVRIDGKNHAGVQISPALGGWAEGDSPLLRITNHPVIPDGSYRRRIIGMSGNDNPSLVDLKIEPTPLS